MRVLTAALFLLPLAAVPAAAQPVYDQIVGIADDPYTDAWAAGAREVLLARYDRDRSGALSTAAEVDAVDCAAWQAMQDAVPMGVREIYGFAEGFGWVGGSLGFDEAQRTRAFEAATRCLPGIGVAEEVGALADPPSYEWQEAVGRLLVRTYDRDGSSALDGVEAKRIECDVWHALEAGYGRGEYHRFWVGYGFQDGLIWNAQALGFDESARTAAYADMQACPRLFADAEAALADGETATTPVPASDASRLPTFTQRLDDALSESDNTLRTGEFVDSWVLYAAQGQQITVEVASDAFDPYVILKSPSGEQFDNDDWEGSTRLARIVHDAAEEGQWEVLATSYRAGDTGAYGVTLSTAFPSDGLASPRTRADLVGTAWAEDCPGTNPSRSYIVLEADGSFSWGGGSADDVSADGGETWEVENGQLVIGWNDRYAVSRYTLTGGGVLTGTSSKPCGSTIRLMLLP